MNSETNALSIIDTVEIDSIANTIKKIEQMQAVVQKTLKNGQDYGEIPGTKKPTLLKPGGEKICMLFGLNPEYEFLQITENYEKEFFTYNIKCTLYRNGQAVAQGVGSCNSKEKKYRFINVDKIPENYVGYQEEFTDKYGRTKYKINNTDICSLVNTILKMAKKRAFIDAVLQVASLSEVFTQDLEDMKDFMQDEQDATLTIEQAKNLKLNFGKYKGTTLMDLVYKDSSYCDWLFNNEKTDPIIKKGLKMILEEATKKSSQPQNEGEEYQDPFDVLDDPNGGEPIPEVLK